MTSFVTKERYAEMKAKFKELYGEIGGSVSINITINGEDYSGEVNPFIKELIEMGEGVNSSCIVRAGVSEEEVKEAVDKVWYESMIRSIRESSKYARGAILNERGQTIWEEPLDEYEKRMKGINGSIRKKSSPPPPPPTRKYKSSWFGFVDVLVNQDEIDAHTETMKKWRGES